MKPTSRYIVVLAAIILGWCAWAVGQEESVPQSDGQQQEVDSQIDEQPQAVPPPPPVSPPPGEEVMVPTRRGMRVTRKMAEAFGQTFGKTELNEKLGLSLEQQDRMAEIITRRAWDLNVRQGRVGSEAMEAFAEAVLRHEGGEKKTMPPEVAREFGDKIRPGLKMIDDFWQGVTEDARPVLDDDQNVKFEEMTGAYRKMTRRLDARLERWSRGEVKENEELMDDLDADEAEVTKEGVKPKEYVEAERQSRWRIDMMGPHEWQQFANRLMKICQFDDAQREAGRKLLDEYKGKANAIMTKEWKAKALANRVRRQLEDRAPRQPLAPYSFHLDREYKQLVQPVQDMTPSFHRDLLALARPEQRDLLFAQLRKLGTDNGMLPEEMANLESWLTPPADPAGEPMTSGVSQSPG